MLSSVTSGGGMTTITGKLNSTSSTMYRIEFFANDAVNPTGYGEGQVFLGFKNVTRLYCHLERPECDNGSWFGGGLRPDARQQFLSPTSVRAALSRPAATS